MASSGSTTIPPLFVSLAQIITGDIDCSHACLTAHSMDGSPYAIRPQAVLYPKTTSDIKHAISFAREYGIPLTVCGGMTAATGGALAEGIVIDLTRYFSQARTLNVVDQTITVDAGMRVDELVQKLTALAVEVPPLDPEQSLATIGGFVATKSATAGTFHHGTIRDWIEGMTVVVDTGEEHHIRDGITPSGRLLGIYQAVFPLMGESASILRASRRECADDATGYALWNGSIGPRQLLDQLVGSEGTLAIITSITFRVVPKKKYSLSSLLPVEGAFLETALSIAKHHQAERLFMFDDTYRTLIETSNQDYLPKELTRGPLYVLITLRGNDTHELSLREKMLEKALGKPLVSLDEHTALQLRQYTFLAKMFKSYSGGLHTIATAGEGIIVPTHIYAESIQALKEKVEASGVVYAISGYAGSGHIALLASIDSKSLAYESNLQEYRERIFSVVEELRGGISAVGGDGLEKTVALPGMYNEATRTVFKKLKEAWDPFSLFNPSKKLAISKDYLSKHVARSLN